MRTRFGGTGTTLTKACLDPQEDDFDQEKGCIGEPTSVPILEDDVATMKIPQLLRPQLNLGNAAVEHGNEKIQEENHGNEEVKTAQSRHKMADEHILRLVFSGQHKSSPE